MVLEIRQEFQDKVTTDSRAMIGALSLLGEGVVDITASATGTPLPDWGYVKSQKTPGQLADVAEGASEGIEELTGAPEGNPRRQGHGRQALHRRTALSRT